MLKKLVRDKHSSFLRKLVNYDRKMFYNIGPRCQSYKTFFSSSPKASQNKLERLLMAASYMLSWYLLVPHFIGRFLPELTNVKLALKKKIGTTPTTRSPKFFAMSLPARQGINGLRLSWIKTD
jgi:hypothetical protein